MVGGATGGAAAASEVCESHRMLHIQGSSSMHRLSQADWLQMICGLKREEEAPRGRWSHASDASLLIYLLTCCWSLWLLVPPSKFLTSQDLLIQPIVQWRSWECQRTMKDPLCSDVNENLRSSEQHVFRLFASKCMKSVELSSFSRLQDETGEWTWH